MAEEIVTQEQEGKKGEYMGMWAAIAYVIASIGQAIRDGGPIELTNMFRVLYRAFLATFLVGGGGAFLWKAAFTPKAFLNEHTGVIVGFITVSALGIAIGFYFGGQDRSKKTDPANGEEIKP